VGALSAPSLPTVYPTALALGPKQIGNQAMGYVEPVWSWRRLRESKFAHVRLGIGNRVTASPHQCECVAAALNHLTGWSSQDSPAQRGWPPDCGTVCRR